MAAVCRKNMQTAAVIGFSSDVSKSLSSMEMRFLLRERGHVAASLFAVMGEKTEGPSQWPQVSDPGGLYHAVRCLPVFNSDA